MANCTEGGNLRGTRNRTLNILPAGIAVFFSSLNIFLAITATLGNVLILIALRKVSSVHPPTKLLFRCLAFTDLCVGLILQPLFSTIMLNDVTMNINLKTLNHIVELNYASSFILCGVSIFTSTAISVDRLLALMLGLRYRHVVTSRRVRASIICFWLIGVSGGITKFFASFGVALTGATVLTLLSLAISAFSYIKIFLRLRQRDAEVQDHRNQGQLNRVGGIPLNMARYKKTVFTIAWVQLALVVCYAPNAIVSMFRAHTHIGSNLNIFWHAVLTLFYLNSSLNPFVYCWKIGEVKQAVKATLREFCFSSS